MQVEITITRQVIAPRRERPLQLPGEYGAMAEFEGLVRGEEDGKAIAALEYEAYEPMAQQMMRQIISEIGLRQPCLFVGVTHRIGLVPVGEAAIQIIVAARHRAPAFAMLAGFMDRLKQEAPIWKVRAIPVAASVPSPKASTHHPPSP